LSKNLDIVILAAGLGTRMKSDLAKVLHRLDGRALINHVCESALALDPDRVVVVVGHQAESVKSEVRGEFAGKPLEFVVQEKQLGTGDAVNSARSLLSERSSTAIVLSGDVPMITAETLQSLLDTHHSFRGRGAACTLLSVRLKDPSGYGRIVRDENGSFARVVEQKDANDEEKVIDEINAGIYCFDTRKLFDALARVNTDNAQGEYYLTDVPGILAADGADVAIFQSADSVEVEGINDRRQLAVMAEAIRSRTVERLMLESGVTFIDPRSAYISARAEIGRDTVIYQNVTIEGTVQIGQRCTIRPGVRVVNSAIGDGVEIKDNTFITDSVVGDSCEVGPMAHLRGKAVMKEGAKVGNFVELKKTTLGEGSKASHLTYLGDATIGTKTNIGAGTITCNYDGKNKHETHIGSNVKIGSDTMLVAPISVGDGASTGAGSVVTKDVEADATVVGVPARPLSKGVTENVRVKRAAQSPEESLTRMKDFESRKENFIASIKESAD
jgi:bifunctional UDP-N-acetylglucosamine pyrophosphorylase / glucosamine-1-phosphate N-acetyltransferase